MNAAAPEIRGDTAQRCTCGDCRVLDREHPLGGWQLRLPVAGGTASPPPHPSHSDAPATDTADVSTVRRPVGKARGTKTLAPETPAMNVQTTIAKPTRKRPTLSIAGSAPTAPPAEPTPTGPVVVPSAPRIFQLGQLRRAPENVRHTRIDEDVTGLADDIVAHGLLQGLIGYTSDWPGDDGKVFIVGGGRRLQALRMVADRGLIDDDFPIPVLIRDVEDAIELSLAENLQQRRMSEVDEFLAFRTLMANGTNSPAGLAKRFGFSERLVKQRLRLADLAEPILDALAKRDITLDAAMAYAGSQDQELQREVFKVQAKKGWEPHRPADIRHALKMKGIRTDDALFRFVGADSYERRGGKYEDDLFEEASGDVRTLATPFVLLTAAEEMIDFQMIAGLRDFQERAELAPSIAGYVIAHDHRVHRYGGHAKHKVPAGMVQVDQQHAAEAMWKRIRRHDVKVHILVGIDDAGELSMQPRTVFVTKADAKIIVPPIGAAVAYTPPDPALAAAEERRRSITLWARRLAIGPFAGTPLEGRTYWPSPYDDRRKAVTVDGTNGWLVTVDIFVTDAAIAEAMPAAEARYEQALADRAAAEIAAEQAEIDANAAAERREAELRALDPFPEVVLIDGDAWARDDEGGYAMIGDEEDGYVPDWPTLLDQFDATDITATFPTRVAYDATLASSEEVTA